MKRHPNRYLRRAERVSSSRGQASVRIENVTGILTPDEVLVASWTASGGRYYYDLAHNRARKKILFQLYDEHTNEYIWHDGATPQSDSTLRIWMAQDPGANRISILYF